MRLCVCLRMCVWVGGCVGVCMRACVCVCACVRACVCDNGCMECLHCGGPPCACTHALTWCGSAAWGRGLSHRMASPEEAQTRVHVVLEGKEAAGAVAWWCALSMCVLHVCAKLVVGLAGFAEHTHAFQAVSMCVPCWPPTGTPVSG